MFKQKDYAAMIIIIAIAAIATFFLANTLISSPDTRVTNVPEVAPISTELAEADVEIFGKDAINPTLDIDIGDSGTDQPFAEQDD